jgi:hypothetical protein
VLHWQFCAPAELHTKRQHFPDLMSASLPPFPFGNPPPSASSPIDSSGHPQVKPTPPQSLSTPGCSPTLTNEHLHPTAVIVRRPLQWASSFPDRPNGFLTSPTCSSLPPHLASLPAMRQPLGRRPVPPWTLPLSPTWAASPCCLGQCEMGRLVAVHRNSNSF